jgi:single-strand DNA-binding protein
MYLNKAIIIGNLTRDPELRATPAGTKVCSFSVATNRVWRDKNNMKQESVDYHDIVTFARQAELVAQYLKRGSGVLVEGRLQTRSWEDKNGGGKRYRTEIIAESVQFGNRPGGGAGAKDIPEAPSSKEVPPAIEYPEEEINPDDIPF